METVHTIVVGREAMGCRFEVIFNLLDNSVATSIGADALNIIEHIEEQLSVYRPSSEISGINASTSTRWHDLSPDVFDLLLLAKQLHSQTNGTFDVTTGPLIKAWGFLQKQGRTPSPEKLAEALACSGMKNIEFHEHEHKIRFHQPDVEINLGAIGKGWAIDKAVDHIDMEGIENFLIHGGHSSVRSRGTRGFAGQQTERDGWPVGLRHPLFRDKRIGTIMLQNKRTGYKRIWHTVFYRKGT